MNWRRGFLLAGIHLGIAIAMMAWDEAPQWPYFTAETTAPHGNARVVAWQDQEPPEYAPNPCVVSAFIEGPTSPQVLIVGSANLPITILTGGGHEACRSRSTLDLYVQARLKRGSHISEVVTCAILAVLIAIQWLLVGTFPLTQIRPWWIEPGAFITLCAGVGILIALPTPLLRSADFYPLREIPAYAAAVGWLVWSALLLWKLLRLGWLTTIRLWSFAHRSTGGGAIRP